MKQTKAIHDALKRLMRSNGRTYADAARVLKLSEASIKRLLSQSELSLERLEKLCDWLGVEVVDVVGLSTESTPFVTALDPLQEDELLRDSALLLIAFLTLNRWTEAEILEIYNFKKADLTQKLRRLEQLGLIELQSSGRIKLLAARNFAWRKDGPIPKYFSDRVLPEFLNSQFNAPGEQMHFVGGMMSQASVLQMHELMSALARECDDLVKKDLALPIDDRYGVSLLIGLRPWELTAFTKLRRKPRGEFLE